MAIEAQVIEDLIRDAFPTADITVDGADGVHMSATVIAEEFSGKSMVAQHRMVFAALKGKMDGPNGELHALALTTKAKS
jgi:acid stress-induced BolA-like protein IbaG/YrbA